MKFLVKSNKEYIPSIIERIKEELLKRKIDKRNLLSSLMSLEDVINKLIDSKEDDNSDITINIVNTVGFVDVRLYCKGKAISKKEIKDDFIKDSDLSLDEQETLFSFYNKIIGKNLLIYNIAGKNIVSLRIIKSQRKNLIISVSSLILGVIVGLILKKIGNASVNNAIGTYILSPIYTMELNAIKLIVCPLVFFSIASCLSDFNDIKSLGKSALKILITYVATSILAILIGILLFKLFPVGDPSLSESLLKLTSTGTINPVSKKSIIQTIVEIVPSDIISPFYQSNMLQVIFLSAIIGIGIGAIKERFPIIKNVIDGLNELISYITRIIVAIIPLMIFASITKMIIDIDITTLLSSISWFPLVYLGCAIMIGIYLLMVLVIARLNPIKFIKKANPAGIMAFSTNSSNATIPTSLQCCEKLGVDRNIYSFSIPLGATINMDGTCILMMIISLFFARTFSIDIDAALLLSIGLSVLTLSLGSPGIPGGSLACVAFIITSLGIPIEAMCVVAGVYAFITMFVTTSNILGDIAITTIIAKKEGKLDVNKYNS